MLTALAVVVWKYGDAATGGGGATPAGAPPPPQGSQMWGHLALSLGIGFACVALLLLLFLKNRPAAACGLQVGGEGWPREHLSSTAPVAASHTFVHLIWVRPPAPLQLRVSDGAGFGQEAGGGDNAVFFFPPAAHRRGGWARN
jgi:hypothetical protein